MAEPQRVMESEPDGPKVIVRFSVKQRVEHFTIMALFALLALTGLPQEFFQSGWALWIVVHLGGIDRVRAIHRIAGILFSVGAAEHIAVMLFLVFTNHIQMSMVPTKKDFSDAVTTLRYYFGLSEHEARFDRYDYRQKFEYWGLIFGSAIMIVTGFILYLPTLFTRIFPGEIIPAAKVAHASEGLLAFLIVIIWHIYNAHLNPDVFPFDTSIFTGKVDAERMMKEHPLEYARLVQGHTPPTPEPTAPERVAPAKTGSDPP